ncbi:hypothetical protein [Paenibacillus harenae]|uniref:hypothetical protein n=1 Tax=Paenibacillus harenae TaxID=306543 RepID=UPI00278D06B5|nr:hypothetical protein [Paenibacillus harenae]MDQ0059985.1 hypothetical protein [Paenibacillus harenae]
MNQFSKFTRPINRTYKFLFSFFKSNWNLQDYPIEFRQQQLLNLSEYPWEARIINWYWMNGDGQSKTEAYLKLKEKFNKYKSEGHLLPRPGRKIQLTYASVERMDQYENEAVHFFKEILEMDYYEMFVSDKTSMYDFCWTDEMLNEKYIQIQEIYGVQIEDIEGLMIADILQRISRRHRHLITSVRQELEVES